MRLTLLATFALLTAALPGLAPAAGATADPCVQYMYVADYHWYYACVDPKRGACAVYTKERHGMTWSERCLVETDPTTVLGAPEAQCYPTSGGMDYPSFLCVDPGNAKCAVYTVTTSDQGVQRRCYGVL